MSNETEVEHSSGVWSNNIVPAPFSFAKLSVGDISIQDKEDWYVFNPLDDISNIELALLLRLFIIAVGASGYSYDYWGFVKSYGLERHFKKKENES